MPLPPIVQPSGSGYVILYPDGRSVPANQDWNGRTVKPSSHDWDRLRYVSGDEAADSIRFAVLNGLMLDPYDLEAYGESIGVPGPASPPDVQEYIDNGRRFVAPRPSPVAESSSTTNRRTTWRAWILFLAAALIVVAALTLAEFAT